MRKLLVVLVAAGALVALGILGAGAFAAPSAKKATNGWGRVAAGPAAAKAVAAASDDSRHLVVIARTLRERGVDLPPSGESTGDVFFFEEAIWNRARTKRIGTTAAECQLGIRTFNCEGTLLLFGRGKIQVDGNFFADRDSVIPVTGGTGHFAGVGGQMVITDLAGGASRYHLLLTR